VDPLDLIQQGKIKRHFRATRKLTTPKLVSHITQRAAGKEPLFIEDNDYLSDFRLRPKSVMASGVFSTHPSLELKCVNFQGYRIIILYV